MALPWLAALKIIPWKDVIAATPQVVKGAQKLYCLLYTSDAADE